MSELTAERNRIDRTITELISSREVLSQVIDAASGPAGEAASMPSAAKHCE